MKKLVQSQQPINMTRVHGSLIAGSFLILLAIFVFILFGFGVEGEATFRLSRPSDPYALPNLVLPAENSIGIASLIIAFFGARLIVKTPKEYAELMNNLNLKNPKMMDIAVPANIKGKTLDQVN